MNRFWEHVLMPIADTVEPACIVEVGTAGGALTAKLLAWAATNEAVVHSIDPEPLIDVEEWRQAHGDRFVFHHGRSLNVLGRIPGVDVALIDGDHNWYTVIHELKLLERTALASDALPPLIALHDVDWPYARRDLYYDPEAIPTAHRQPYERKGVIPGEGELSHEGLNDHLQNAIYEHAIHNGVRSAIEDFIAESALEWTLADVPGLHGVAILATAERLTADAPLAALLTSFASAAFLLDWAREIELARIGAEIGSDALRDALHRANERLADVERSAKEAAEEFARQRNELEQERDQHRSERDELRPRTADLEAALDRAASERAQRKAELDAQRAHYEAQREALDAERERLSAEVDELAADRERLDRELADQLTRFRAAREELAAEIERMELQSQAAVSTEAELRRELTATRSSLEEADELRRAAQVGADPHHSASPLSGAGAIWIALGSALHACDESINETIAERDPARSGKREDYLAVSRSALRAILQALAAAGLPEPATILDLPCGYGRVTRALRAAWPRADLVAADQSTAAVAFCVEQFAAEGWEVSDYLGLNEHSERQRERFDLIWSASLLPSVDPKRIDDCLSAVLGMLRPGGVLVAAYHGRDSARRFGDQTDQGLRTLAQSFGNRGVGFLARESTPGLGTAAMTPQWLLPHLTRDRHAMVLSITERGWADHLDIVAITRRDVHHSQINLASRPPETTRYTVSATSSRRNFSLPP